jgi:predicted ATP-grasp superfamily ATP-dependent carboligase
MIKKTLKQQLKFIESEMKYTLVTTRFNEETYQENKTFRKKHNEKFGCIYGIPGLNMKMSIDKPIYVLEMNNTQNRIMGIGCIQNKPVQKPIFIYNVGNYNRYVFIGKYRIDRTEMSEQEEQVMQIFDYFCFKGAGHLKRGQGFIIFPTKIIYKCDYFIHFNLLNSVSEMFNKRFQ